MWLKVIETGLIKSEIIFLRASFYASTFVTPWAIVCQKMKLLRSKITWLSPITIDMWTTVQRAAMNSHFCDSVEWNNVSLLHRSVRIGVCHYMSYMRLSLRDITGVHHGLVRRILKRLNQLMIQFGNARTHAVKRGILDTSRNSDSTPRLRDSLVTTFFHQSWACVTDAYLTPWKASSRKSLENSDEVVTTCLQVLRFVPEDEFVNHPRREASDKVIQKNWDNVI